MKPPCKILVNAIPLTLIHTGIARYLKCLYAKIEGIVDPKTEIWYFDGRAVSRKMPARPENLPTWSRLADWFWKLPTPVALLLRLAVHFRRELAFRSVLSGMDLYHEAGFFPFSVPPGVKVVFTLHDFSLYRFPQHHPRERVIYSKLFLQRRCRRVNRFLAISQFTREEAMNLLGISKNRITVTHLAQDGAVFYPRLGQNRPLVCNGRELPERYFLFVGSGDPRKNMEIIPEALKAAGLPMPLVTVGWSGWLKTMKNANILQLGYLSDTDLARLYSRAIALVFPSRYEGFGLPILEAMACGCPVITTRAASIPEVAGGSAIFMDHPRDVSGLAKLMRELAHDQSAAESLRLKGLDQAARFSWAATASATWETFQHVLAE